MDEISDVFDFARWNCIWVVQEFAVTMAVEFACGGKKLSRPSCEAAYRAITMIHSINTLIYSNRQTTEYERAVITSNFTRDRRLFCIRDRFNSSEFTFLSLLRLTCVVGCESTQGDLCFMNASDPKHRIYGLVGLASDRLELGIVPDYGSSCVKMYPKFALQVLRRGNLSILSLCQFSKTIRNLPSWVPDWSTPSDMQHQHAQYPRYSLLTPCYCALGKASRQPIRFDSNLDNRLVLVLTGLLVDTVHTIGRDLSLILSAKPYQNGHGWLQEWIHVPCSLCQVRPGLHSKKKRSCRRPPALAK